MLGLFFCVMDNNSNRGEMPKKIEILQHWAEILIKDYGKFWLDVLWDNFDGMKQNDKIIMQTSYCFACGCNVGTERSHIIPVCDGGGHNVQNIHLLCKECHIESEYFSNSNIYWDWFKMKNPNNSGSYLRIENKTELALEYLKKRDYCRLS